MRFPNKFFAVGRRSRDFLLDRSKSAWWLLSTFQTSSCSDDGDDDGGDDDDSVTSTRDQHKKGGNNKGQQEPSPLPPRKPSRVRFDPQSVVYYQEPKEDHHHQDAEDLWYTEEELLRFKEQRNEQVKQQQALELLFGSDSRSYFQVVNRVFQAFCNVNCSDDDDNENYKTKDENIESALQEKIMLLLDNKDDLDAFDYWIGRTCETRLGLERSIVTNIVTDRQRRRDEMLELVQSIQRNVFYKSAEERAHSLALGCRAMSLPCRLLATHLARAAAAAPVQQRQQLQQEQQQDASAAATAKTALVVVGACSGDRSITRRRRRIKKPRSTLASF